MGPRRGVRLGVLYVMSLVLLAAAVLAVDGRVWEAVGLVGVAIVLGWIAGLWSMPAVEDTYDRRLARLLRDFGDQAQAMDLERIVAEREVIGDLPGRDAPVRFEGWHGQLVRAGDLRDALIRNHGGESALLPALSEATSAVLAGVSEDGIEGPSLEYAWEANRVSTELRALSEDFRERSIEAMRSLARVLGEMDPPDESVQAHVRLINALLGYERAVEATPRADVGGPEAAKARTQNSVAAWDELHDAIGAALR